MYQVNLGFDNAIKRIESLLSNGFNEEGLIISVFTFEKMLRRTLKQLIVSAGLKSKDANTIMKQVKGNEKIKDYWSIYDPTGRDIIKIIGNKNWKLYKDVYTMRNKMIHGERLYKEDEYKTSTNDLMISLKDTKSKLHETYGYSGWDRVSVRKKSKLHLDPKVKT